MIKWNVIGGRKNNNKRLTSLKSPDMENTRKEQQDIKRIDIMENQNTSLQEPGAAVTDYGNVDGGPANEAEGGSNENSTRRNAGPPSQQEDTIGIP